MKFCSTNMKRKQETPGEVNLLPRTNPYKIDQQEKQIIEGNCF